jgi:diadenosine tetraphosphate (Ap4A) HIT family hydrolase
MTYPPPGFVRAETVVEDGPTWTIAVNINQNLLGKTVVVLNRPCQSVTDLTLAEWTDLYTQIKRIRVALDLLFEPDLCNYAFLMNVDRQVHLHVIPRYESVRQWSGQQFEDPHGGEVFGTEQRVLEPTELEGLRDEIRAGIPAMA